LVWQVGAQKSLCGSRIAVDGHGHDAETLTGKLFVQAGQPGQRVAARRAPGCPEFQIHEATTVVRQTHLL